MPPYTALNEKETVAHEGEEHSLHKACIKPQPSLRFITINYS